MVLLDKRELKVKVIHIFGHSPKRSTLGDAGQVGSPGFPGARGPPGDN